MNGETRTGLLRLVRHMRLRKTQLARLSLDESETYSRRLYFRELLTKVSVMQDALTMKLREGRAS